MVGETVENITSKVDLSKIKALRKAKELTGMDMAILLGLKSSTGYSYLESGRCGISAERLALIATKLEVCVNDLYITPEPTGSVI
jgi:transcriptional regulator with XRE-family HTH domain